MSNYRNISLSFWTDSKVDDEFTPEDKYFYLYLLTNPHTNICGCYEISMKAMERETGYNSDTINRLIKRMSELHNVIRYSKTTKEILVLNWSKYNWSSSDKVIKAVKSVAEYIKSATFKKYILEKLENGKNSYIQITDIDTESDTETDTDTDVSIPYAYGIDTISEKEQKKKTDYDVLIDEYTCNDMLITAIYEFIKMRKGIKKPITCYGLKRILNELDRLATNDDEKIQILDKSIERSWAGVFELNNNGANSKEKEQKLDPKESYKGKTIYEMTPEEREIAYEEGWDDV